MPSLETLAVLVLLAPPVPQDAPEKVSPACSLVTQEEAVSILGPKAERLTGDTDDTCHYVVDGQPMQIVMRIEEMRAGPGDKFLAVVRRPAMEEKGYKIQDEPTLGKGSFSAAKADSVDFQVVYPKGAFSVGVRDESAKIPPDTRDKLRAVAKKALGRLP
jgi:hypothetical protein